MSRAKQCLLIGNTRWHWAKKIKDQWEFIHEEPDPQKLINLSDPLFAWAAVGAIPTSVRFDPLSLIELRDIPLKQMPVWLGIDRALGAWGALKRAKACGMSSQGLLVADAGTVLSLTKVTSNGDFCGGQLIAGLQLQLKAMDKGTKQLNNPGLTPISSNFFPTTTADAMRVGSVQALCGSLIEAHHETGLPIWLCGGDAPFLLKALKRRNVEVAHHPNLVLEGMVEVATRLNEDPNQ